MLFGSIPAHTGERASRTARTSQQKVYPRTYGGTHTAATSDLTVPGLSPHIRGNDCRTYLCDSVSGSIPAHTGERKYRTCSCGPSGVYPRTYGGTTSHNLCQYRQLGLSPHIRGNECLNLHTRQHQGSIPAHTGERAAVRAGGREREVYPRTYGGTSAATGRLRSTRGLSPHIRGNGRTRYPEPGTRGSIPAHTGERAHVERRRPLGRVYPRTYGGTGRPSPRLDPRRGLSPHIRGNDRLPSGQDLDLGSIPAHTGERQCDRLRGHSFGVYPRTYGGTAGIHRRGNRVLGLSPHIRGNAVNDRPYTQTAGSIPAHTGERMPCGMVR